MHLTAGTRLGPYEIVAPAGAGGDDVGERAPITVVLNWRRGG